jgi:hypothetical protein
MYEPIIDPMIFYWIDILEKAGSLPPLTLLGGFLGGVFIFIVCTLRDCTDKQLGKYLGTWGAFVIVSFLILCLVNVFIPSKDTMYKMLIAKQVTPHNLQVTGETVDKALDKVVEKIIKITQEVKK